VIRQLGYFNVSNYSLVSIKLWVKYLKKLGIAFNNGNKIQEENIKWHRYLPHLPSFYFGILTKFCFKSDKKYFEEYKIKNKNDDIEMRSRKDEEEEEDNDDEEILMEPEKIVEDENLIENDEISEEDEEVELEEDVEKIVENENKAKKSTNRRIVIISKKNLLNSLFIIQFSY
jgi:hypothetical protein